MLRRAAMVCADAWAGCRAPLQVTGTCPPHRSGMNQHPQLSPTLIPKEMSVNCSSYSCSHPQKSGLTCWLHPIALTMTRTWCCGRLPAVLPARRRAWLRHISLALSAKWFSLHSSSCVACEQLESRWSSSYSNINREDAKDRAQVDAGERKGSRWVQQSLGQDFKIAKLLMNFILTEIPTLNSGHSYEAGCPTKEKSIRASPPALPAERDGGDAAWQLSAGRVSAPNHCWVQTAALARRRRRLGRRVPRGRS